MTTPDQEEPLNQFEDLTTSDLIKCPDGYSIFNPYNPRNVEITQADITAILGRYGVPQVVANMEIYKRAFVESSYVKYPAAKNDILKIRIAERPADCMPLKSKSNQRLEFIGDGILNSITMLYLYRRFPKANEGFMTDKKIAIVKNEAIGRICYEMGLNKWLILSRAAEDKGVRTDYKRLGCLFEAFLGALFLNMNQCQLSHDGQRWIAYGGVGGVGRRNWHVRRDDVASQPQLPQKDDVTDTGFEFGPGYQMAQRFVENVFERHIDWTELILKDDNYKNIFQEKLQKEFKLTPNYLEISGPRVATAASAGLTDRPDYVMGVFLCLGQSIHNMHVEDAIPIEQVGADIMSLVAYTQQHDRVFICFGTGKHKLKKKAEQLACKRALLSLGFACDDGATATATAT
jgi:dsRNA-specific ribonuclease